MDAKYIQPPLEHHTVYHIYNGGINGCPIFHTEDDYTRFLSKMDKYILPIAEIYAWALLGNHFHFLVRIKRENEIKSVKELKLFDKEKNKELEDKKPDISMQFSHLFNSYAQYYNHKYKRHSSLFEHQFKRKKVNNREYFKRCVIYIHQNPIKHGFVTDIRDYPYTSFHEMFNDGKGRINKEIVLRVFDNLGNFNNAHNEMVELD